MKEKFKMLKEDIKMWHMDKFGDLDKRIMAWKEEILKLDMIDEALGFQGEMRR